MLQLILGRAGFGKTEAIRRLIKQTGPTAKAQILVVPEQFSFESEKALMAVDGKCRTLRCFPFRSFATGFSSFTAEYVQNA